MHPTARRVAASVLAWTMGAAASITVSLLALSSIQAGAAVGPPQQLAPNGFADAGNTMSNTASSEGDNAATPSSNGATSAVPPTRSPGAAAGSVQRLLASPGGTVTARCTGTSAYLVSWSPAQGYRVSHVQRGPATEAGVTFRSTTSRTEIEIEIHCVAGTPTLDEHLNDGHRDD